MKHFAVIGRPVEHSLSPVLFNWVFKLLNIQAEYKKIMVGDKEVPNIIQQIKNSKIVMSFSFILIILPFASW